MFEQMTTLALQEYWWVIISLLGGILVFLLFVQGGQTLLYQAGKTEIERTMIINALGHKWELTFTTLVTFGGAFFASFPLFYATSFGGAYWVWILILMCFVLQAVAYEFRTKAHNLLGHTTYETFLMVNGFGATLLLGTAVATFFTGSPFAIDINPQSGLVNPTWMGAFGGLELAFDLSLYTTFINLSLGAAVLLLSRLLGAMYLKNRIESEEISTHCAKIIRQEMPFFLLFFLFFLINIMVRYGYEYSADGYITTVPQKYLLNLLQMPIVGIMLVVGVLSVLQGIILGGFTKSKKGIFFAGAGTVLTVMSLFLITGLNNTVYYPAIGQWIQNGLTIENSSSGRYTLVVMSYVSILVPFVLGYIVYVWRKMDHTPIDKQNIKEDEHTY
ncbi:MAG: cytochrome d ubiquinol oxidase subunit II [Flavobacteriales bacterium]|nr:cytochrome d ubiquinol oxidase subunit II [Flavobacteriales bacterium]